MRFSRRVAVIAVSVLLLVVGVVLGFLPVRATLTQIEPELRLLTVSCGNGYLQAAPPVQPGDLVGLPDEPGVLLPRASYAAHCAGSAGWKRYAAWGLTALGALGLAITYSGARTPSGPDGSAPAPPVGGPSARSGSSNGSDRSGGTSGRSGGSGSGRGSGDGPGGRSPEPSEPESSEPADPSSQAGASRGRHSRRNEPAS